MSFHDQYPAYGGRGPGDFRLGVSLAVIATIFMILRVYVRLRVNKFGTTALLLSLLAYVCPMCMTIEHRGHLLMTTRIDVYSHYSSSRHLFRLSWPRQPHVRHCQDRQYTRLPSFHLGHRVLLQPGHPHWQSGCSGIFN